MPPALCGTCWGVLSPASPHSQSGVFGIPGKLKAWKTTRAWYFSYHSCPVLVWVQCTGKSSSGVAFLPRGLTQQWIHKYEMRQPASGEEKAGKTIHWQEKHWEKNFKKKNPKGGRWTAVKIFPSRVAQEAHSGGWWLGSRRGRAAQRCTRILIPSSGQYASVSWK